MVCLQQTNKYCSVTKLNATTLQVFGTRIEHEGDERIHRLYLGFKLTFEDLPKVIYKPNVYWGTDIYAMSNTVYYDKMCNECFVILYTDKWCVCASNLMGTIECIEGFDINSKEYAVNTGNVFYNVTRYITEREKGNSAVFNKDLAYLDTFECAYDFSWLGTAIMLYNRCYIELTEEGEVCDRYKWLFEEIRGFRENCVAARLKELANNGVLVK